MQIGGEFFCAAYYVRSVINSGQFKPRAAIRAFLIAALIVQVLYQLNGDCPDRLEQASASNSFRGIAKLTGTN